MRPRDLVALFSERLANLDDATRQSALAMIPPPDPWDTHPPLPERIAFAAAQPVDDDHAPFSLGPLFVDADAIHRRATESDAAARGIAHLPVVDERAAATEDPSE